MKFFTFILAFILFAAAGQAQESNKAGTTAAQFLKIGVGARSVAMAGASAGLVNDASSMYWNPAGLTNVRSITMTASYIDWLVDIKHQYFGLVLPLNEDNKVGINATVLFMGKMEITTEREPQGTGNFFEASDVAVGVTYATRLVDFFSFGMTVKYITQNIYNESASAIAVDLGTTLNTGYKGIKIGMSFSNFGTTMKLEGRDLRKTYDPNPNNANNVGVASNLTTESWELPVNFRVGVGWDIIGKEDALMWDGTNRLRLAVDANHPNDSPENASVGLEYSWQNLIAFRTGYHINDEERNLTYGLGLYWNIPKSFSVGVDYAYVNFKRLGAIHCVSVAIGF